MEDEEIAESWKEMADGGKSKSSSSRVPIVIQDSSLPRSPLYRLASSRGPAGVISS